MPEEQKPEREDPNSEIPDFFVEWNGAPESAHWLAKIFGSQIPETLLVEAGYEDPGAVKHQFLDTLHSLTESDEGAPIRCLLDGLEASHYREFEEEIGDRTVATWEGENPDKAHLIDEERARQFVGMCALFDAGKKSTED